MECERKNYEIERMEVVDNCRKGEIVMLVLCENRLRGSRIFERNEMKDVRSGL